MNQANEAGIEAGLKAKKKKLEGGAEVIREYTPVEGAGVHGVTFDGKLVWFAIDDALVAFDPSTEKVDRRFSIPGASAGTAYDGRHIYQLAGPEIVVVDPSSGAILRRLPAPGKGADSGMAYADGYLWVGQYRDAKIHQIDAKTGALVKTLSSDRFVTGVSCFGGALWHGVSDGGQPCELRRLAPDGTVEEAFTIADAEHLAGVEGTGDGAFWCGGERGKLRLVRPTRSAARG